MFCYCWEKLDVGHSSGLNVLRLAVFKIQVASNKLKSQNDYKFYIEQITMCP